jgi:hypothetical protein
MPTLMRSVAVAIAAVVLLAAMADAARPQYKECKWQKMKHTCEQDADCCGEGCCTAGSHCCGDSGSAACCKGEQERWILIACVCGGIAIVLFLVLYCGAYRRVCCRKDSRRPEPTVAEAVPSPTEMEDGVVTGEAPDAVKLKTVYGMASNEPLASAEQAPECYGGDGPARTFGYVASPAEVPPVGEPGSAFDRASAPRDSVPRDNEPDTPGAPQGAWL